MSRFTRFNNWRKKQRNILLVSAMGTGLGERHFNLDNDLWSAKALVTAPEKVKSVTRDYLSEGFNLSCCDSYQATEWGFEDAGYTKAQAKHYIKLSVKLAKEGRAESKGRQAKFIDGSIGPYGAYLHDGSEYTGDYHLTAKQYKHFHINRLRWLIEAGCDTIAAGTMPNFAEIRAVCQLFRRYPKVPAIVTCSLRDGHHIADGTDLHTVQNYLEKQPTVVGYGMNCFPPKYAIPAIKYLRENAKTDQDIIAFPNAGADYDPKIKQWGKPIPHVFSNNALKWRKAGAKCVGGCCGIDESELGKIHQEFLAKK